MRNLVAYETNPLGEYDAIVAAKQQPRRAILQQIQPRVARRYHEYARVKKSLASLPTRSFTGDEAEALLHCYEDTEALTDLLGRIRSSQPERVRWHCQYCCGMSRSPTWDHYVHKAEHPEFSVYPPNLVPSCGECNNLKTKWIENGLRTCIHFYYDDIDPELVLIDAQMDFEADGLPRPTFRLAYDARRARSPIKRLFARHFKMLDLAKRLREASFAPMDVIGADIHTFTPTTPIALDAEIRDLLTSKAGHLSRTLGANHISSILYRAAAKSPALIRFYRRGTQARVGGGTP